MNGSAGCRVQSIAESVNADSLFVVSQCQRRPLCQLYLPCEPQAAEVETVRLQVVHRERHVIRTYTVTQQLTFRRSHAG